MTASRPGPAQGQRNGGSEEPALPLVTIITPTYNQADFLAETINCILAQTYGAIEYVVVDDGSTDDTQRVLSQFEGKITWRTQTNRGQSQTLNESWDRANGTYLTYLSSDDLLHPDAIERLVAYLEAHPETACVFPDADLVDINSRVVRRAICRPFVLDDLVVEQECWIGPGAVFRKSVYQDIGGWEPGLKLAPDREFWMRVSRKGRIDFLPEVLGGYRIHPESISYKTVSETAALEYIRVLDSYFAAGAPPEIEARRDEAYGRAHLLIARNCYRGRQFERGNHHYARARALHPPLGNLRTRATIARAIISKPIRTGLARLRRLVPGT